MGLNTFTLRMIILTYPRNGHKKRQPGASIFNIYDLALRSQRFKPKAKHVDPGKCYDLTLRELNELLSLLKVEYIDLVLLHGPSEPFGYEGGCSDKVCELNRARYTAYNTFYSQKRHVVLVFQFCQSCLQCLKNENKAFIPPAVNQIQMHVGMGADPEGLISYCNDNDIVVQTLTFGTW